MSWERIVVNQRERLLLTGNGRFDRILVPGDYHVSVAQFTSLESEKHNISNPVFRSKWANYFIRFRPDLVERHFTYVETSDTQVAMVYLNGELLEVLVPAKRQLFWRDSGVVTAELADVVADAEPPSELFEAVWKDAAARC